MPLWQGPTSDRRQMGELQFSEVIPEMRVPAQGMTRALQQVGVLNVAGGQKRHLLILQTSICSKPVTGRDKAQRPRGRLDLD